jgi:hypothetical protein
MKSVFLLLIAGTFAIGFDFVSPVWSANYYISPNGLDSSDGLSPGTAWQTVAKVNATKFAAGDQIFFQRGGVWRESLMPSCDGTPDAPIVFSVFGDGNKPVFCGSDLLPELKEWKREGDLWTCSIAAKVNCVLDGSSFLRSAALLPSEKSVAAIQGSLQSTPRSWLWENGILKVNIGLELPKGFSAVTRDNMVLVDRRQHLVFRDLAVTDTACFNSGYGFSVFFSSDITLENCEARRCGKHHFSLINSTKILLNRCYAAEVMPDQGIGGACAYVSFSDHSRKGDSSRYVDCVTENYFDEPSKSYHPAFLSHGEGIGTIELEGMISRGSTIILSNDKTTGGRTRMSGGLIEDASLHLYGNGLVVENVTIRRGVLEFLGSDDVAQNMLIEGFDGGFQGYQCAVVVHNTGSGNILRSSTVRVAASAPAFNAPICLLGNSPTFRWTDNSLKGPGLALRVGQEKADLSKCQAKGNTYSMDAEFQFDSNGRKVSFADWQMLGLDQDSKQTP